MMKYVFLLLLQLNCLFQSITSQPTPSEDFPHHVILDLYEDVWLYWKIDDIYVTFEMHGKTTGWVGVGISPSGGMIDADIFVGWVKDGVPTITDRHGQSENAYPPFDDEQDLTLLGGDERNGWTRIKFQRQIAGCEKGFDLPLTTSTLKMIWAMHPGDPEGGDFAPENYHGADLRRRGSRSVLILEAGRQPNTEGEEGNTEFNDFLMDGIEITAEETFYSCKLLKFIQPPSKRHIIKIEPVITHGNENNVHHMVMYQCQQDPLDISNVNRSHECYVPNMPDDFRACNLMIHAWAIGGEALYYPENAGFPIGTDDAPRYVMLEIHYDNPTRQAGIVDNSGVRIFHTSQLREYDAGAMIVGRRVNPFAFLIPPNADNFLSYGECPSNCLGAAMNYAGKNEIRVFGAALHTHLLGRAITFRHIAENQTTELPYITEDGSYDFNYQEVKFLPQEVVIRQGESLQLVCNYNSTGRENFTQGGLGTPEEMCFAYMYYYPKIPLTGCATGPFFTNIFQYFGISNYTLMVEDFSRAKLNDVTVLGPEHMASRKLGDILNSMEWNQESAEQFSEFERYLLRTVRCRSPVDLHFSKIVTAPIITDPYRPPVATCLKSSPTPITTPSSAPLLRGSNLLVTVLIIGSVVLPQLAHLA